MNPTRVLYEPIEDVERMEYYQPGGYHPVTIGDHLHGRYRVIHKLGHGTYSTIWLARDERSRIYVAVKVCTAYSKPPEIDVISELSQPPLLSDIGRTMIPSIFDKFNIQGPNGEHICLVTKPARMSLSDAKNGSWISLFQLEVARVLAAQLAIAIHYIHSRGFVHGDLHRGSILLQLRRDFDQLSTKRLYEQYGEPVLEPVNRLDGQMLPPGVPQYGVLPIWLGEASENITLPEARIIVSDFGESFSPAREVKSESHTPLSIRPPEARFEPTKPLTFSSDIWTLACTIWDIIAQKPLFEGFLTNEDDMTCQQIDALGLLPTEWWGKWGARQGHFTEHGEPINPSRSPRRTLEDRFESNVQRPRIKEGMSPVDSSERDSLYSMLRSMLLFGRRIVLLLDGFWSRSGW
ncbi:kinase-like protein [Aspergillus aculeatinus CBS 121060]|uniref:Kinase-like protein n=1 Tax=Aspergillus aculeatinus CBS 121060 TaxID=1448322 RepID=A0ACD1H7S6_9EURO|nr:kinase-like protein [Aspergillus aculeatinus CBS 121060]RAH69458.1 kinase-like protein [Aspergillus aculeatinus CBS 121060]